MNEKLSKDGVILVAKRDGDVEPFEFSKLLNCIKNGIIAGGEVTWPDAHTATALAEAVLEYLRTSYSASPVPSRHLAELVDLILSQTGQTAAGMAIRQHAQYRTEQRRRLLVATPRPGDGRFVQHRWSKTLLVQHLRRHHGLDTPASRMIAGRVEQLMFNCGLRAVTVGLVREMVRSELLAWGLLPGALVVKRVRNQRARRRVEENYDSA